MGPDEDAGDEEAQNGRLPKALEECAEGEGSGEEQQHLRDAEPDLLHGVHSPLTPVGPLPLLPGPVMCFVESVRGIDRWAQPPAGARGQATASSSTCPRRTWITPPSGPWSGRSGRAQEESPLGSW